MQRPRSARKLLLAASVLLALAAGAAWRKAQPAAEAIAAEPPREGPPMAAARRAPQEASEVAPPPEEPAEAHEVAPPPGEQAETEKVTQADLTGIADAPHRRPCQTYRLARLRRLAAQAGQ